MSMPRGALSPAPAAGAGVVPAATVPGRYPGFGPPAYQGGPILTGAIPVYPIFYSDKNQGFGSGYEQAVLGYLASMSGTSYWQTVEQGYTDRSGSHPGDVVLQSPIYDTSAPLGGTTLDATSLGAIVYKNLSASTPANAVFLVFTADNITYDDGTLQFCSNMMGFHNQQTFRLVAQREISVTSQYAFIGSPERCTRPSGGYGAWDNSANGSNIDIAISVAFHELGETATDPDTATGWTGAGEGGDICAWVPGPITGTTEVFDLGYGKPYVSSLVGFAANGVGN
jgi:hypothetical protein